jgi:hypothetical protein
MNSSPSIAERNTAVVLRLLSTFITSFALVLFLPPLPQSPHYHHFIDSRTIAGIPNFWNVISNAAFLLAGGLGMAFCLRRNHSDTSQTPYLAYFAGVFLTGVGSAYYHWAPNNERLIWDRLPLAIMFMSLLAAVIADTIGTQLLGPLLLLGIGSVINWATLDMSGAGDLRFYVLVQFAPLVAIPLMSWLLPSRHNDHQQVIGAIGWYALAKVAEQLDAPIHNLIGISGHTIKHVLCGISAYWVLRMLRRRNAYTQATQPRK